MLGTRDKVGERVPLVEQPPLVPPATAKLPAPAHVGLGERDPSIDQRQPQRGEPWLGNGAISAVAIEAERPRPSGHPRRSLAKIDDRDRDLGAVLSRGVDALGDITARIVAAEHLDLLEYRPLPGRQV